MKFAAAALCLIAYSPIPAELSFQLVARSEAGQLESGYDFDSKYNASGSTLFRGYLDAALSFRWAQQFQFKGGVRGFSWKPNDFGNASVPYHGVKFNLNLSETFLNWSPTETMDLSVGKLFYKYNGYARNLGEYMFRSEAYPTLLTTGGWEWLDDAGIRTTGMKLTWGDESFKQDFCVFGEILYPPVYDFSPAYIATWKPRSAFSFGGGVSFHRYLSPNSGTRKHLTRDIYFYDNFTIPAGQPGSPDSARPRTTMPRLVEDIRRIAAQDGFAAEEFFEDPANTGLDSQIVSFDNRAVKIMLFAAIDLNRLLGWNSEDNGPFELYGELAQLGLENEPIFYTHSSQRMPIMLGISAPTFGLLKTLSFEMEMLANPNIESQANLLENLDLLPDPEYRYRTFAGDDIKWSIYASREIGSSWSIAFQLANDHMRLLDAYGRPESVPVTNRGRHWYWLTRIQWSL